MKNHRTHFLSLCAAALVSALTLRTARAQVQTAEAAIQQQQRVEQRQQLTKPLFRETLVPQLYSAESADVGPQYVVLPAAQKRKWIEASIDSQFFYTSNVFLTEKGNVDSSLWVTTAILAFAPTPWETDLGKVEFRTGYRHQKFNYGGGTDDHHNLNNFDFDVGTVFMQVRHEFKENWFSTVGWEYNRLLSAENDFHEFYVEFLPYWGIERRFQFGESALLSLGYIGNYHATRVDRPLADINDRTDQIFSIIYSQQLLPRLVLQPYYRLQYTHYVSNPNRRDRNDWLHSMGVSLTYFINDWASVRLFSNYDNRDSNDNSAQDYHKFDTGGGVNVTLRF